VRRGDDEFFTIVKWVVFALIEAEEYGIAQGNVDGMRASSTDPVVQRILARRKTPASCSGSTRLGVPRDQGVGNYGEMFERNVGPKSALKLRAARTTCGTRRPDVRGRCAS